MQVVPILITVGATLYGAFLGLVTGRITAWFVSSEAGTLNAFSGAGAILCGCMALVMAIFQQCDTSLHTDGLVNTIRQLMLFISASGLIVPAVTFCCWIIAIAMKKTSQAIDRIFRRS